MTSETFFGPLSLLQYSWLWSSKRALCWICWYGWLAQSEHLFVTGRPYLVSLLLTRSSLASLHITLNISWQTFQRNCKNNDNNILSSPYQLNTYQTGCSTENCSSFRKTQLYPNQNNINHRFSSNDILYISGGWVAASWWNNFHL